MHDDPVSDVRRVLLRFAARRVRNREHAKRSRVRKKFLLDSLQRSVDALQVFGPAVSCLLARRASLVLNQSLLGVLGRDDPRVVVLEGNRTYHSSVLDIAS